MDSAAKDYKELLPALGEAKLAFEELLGFIYQNYEMEELWTAGKPTSNYHSELKYKRGGKTLITLYMRENYFLAQVILGKAERDKFEKARNGYSEVLQKIYDTTDTLHDGKWLGIKVYDNALIPDITSLLLLLKRRPNRKDMGKLS